MVNRNLKNTNEDEMEQFGYGFGQGVDWVESSVFSFIAAIFAKGF